MQTLRPRLADRGAKQDNGLIVLDSRPLMLLDAAAAAAETEESKDKKGKDKPTWAGPDGLDAREKEWATQVRGRFCPQQARQETPDTCGAATRSSAVLGPTPGITGRRLSGPRPGPSSPQLSSARRRSSGTTR